MHEAGERPDAAHSPGPAGDRRRPSLSAKPAADAPPTLVTVIIPARDEEAYVEGALRSVLAQGWPTAELEAIVSANGCSDGTNAVVRAFALRHPELRLRLLEDPFPGIARAKNRGASEAGGRLLVFLDADSRMAPDLVERIVEHESAGAPAGSIRITCDGGDPLDRGFFGLMEYGKRLFGIRANMLYCARTTFFEHGGFDETLEIAEDRDLLVRLQRAGLEVSHVRSSWIATSPRRLHSMPFRLGVVAVFARWALAHANVGRRWSY